MLIVSKDSDFRQRSFLFGAPPEVASIAMGNCSTKRRLKILSRLAPDSMRYLSDQAQFGFLGCLVKWIAFYA